MDIEFIEVTDAWGQSIPLARPLAEQAAATGQAVAVWLTPDACRAALAGRRDIPPTRPDGAGNTVLCDVDQAILDLLYRMDAPMTGPDIAEAVGNSLSYVKERLTPAAPLRADGLVANRPRVGYYIAGRGADTLHAPRTPPLDRPMRLAMRRLKRGDATTAQLAAAAERTTKTVANWVSEDGPLYARGVRRVRKGVYTWPNAHDVSLDDN